VVVVSHIDLQRLRRCVELARTALNAGHGPFGAVLIGADDPILYGDHNHVTDNDQPLHAELGVARWAIAMAGADAGGDAARHHGGAQGGRRRACSRI
jgi:tRNA(Arg) A34 adenosine deaminase TadA